MSFSLRAATPQRPLARATAGCTRSSPTAPSLTPSCSSVRSLRTSSCSLSSQSSSSSSTNTTATSSTTTNQNAPLLVSSPHPVSHIRLIRYRSDPSLSSAERAWHAHRENVQLWHHEFWTDNNTHFQNEKAAFEAAVQDRENRPATPHELSVFYKQYLDTSLSRHTVYNGQLWKENLRMLNVAARAEVARSWRIANRTAGGLDAWWSRVGQTIVRIGGGHRAQGITFR
ncbi:hypothetical protein HKX48_006856 [Thoreauomyces humboldtii]|nr:hypothetical protein HKX48_006856 [Thoreauomyces humboldtii]